MKRLGVLFLIAIVPPQCGCSMFLAMSGKDVEDCSTREEVRAKLGKPVATVVEDGKEYDDFYTHWKIAERVHACELGLQSIFTLGLIEFVIFPNELYHAVRNITLGQDLRVYYDANGKVKHGESKRLKLHGYGFSYLTGRPIRNEVVAETNEKAWSHGWILPADVVESTDKPNANDVKK